jgi:hypothetical protein
VKDGACPQTTLDGAPALLDRHELHVAKRQVFGRQAVIVRCDDPFAVELRFFGDGGCIDLEATNASTGNAGNLFIALRPKPGRKSTADEVIARLRPKVGHIPGIRLFLQAVQDLRVGGRSARSTSTRSRTPGSRSSTNGRRACSRSCAACRRSRT